ncbi:MAG: glycosyltransferase family 4 protein [Saprospiraceae bacterium]|nr:glycosyltransferase family 4 protein [Saprospiraceae bacterium]
MAAECFGNLAAIVVSRRVDFPVSSRNFLTRRKYNHPRIKTVICISHQIKKVLSPAIRDTTKLIVVHSGIDLSKFSNSSNLLRTNYGLAEHIFVVGNVAAIAGHKDYFTFVNTAKVLIEARFPVHFFIIGADGGEQSAIEKHIQMLDLQNHITLTGYRNDIPKLLPALDVLLFTSKEEGLGTTILDAFASRVAVVATRAGGIPEMVEHESTGMLADIGDSLALANHVKTVLLDTHLKSRIQENAWRKVQEFSKENMAAGVLRVYHN